MFLRRERRDTEFTRKVFFAKAKKGQYGKFINRENYRSCYRSSSTSWSRPFICLAREFEFRNIAFERQKACPLTYKGLLIEEGYRIDFIIEKEVIVEIKSIDNFQKFMKPNFLLIFVFLRFDLDFY